jgi:hypothetical protein
MIIVEAMTISFLFLTKRIGLLNLFHCSIALEGVKNGYSPKVLTSVTGKIASVVVRVSFRHFDFAVDNVSL